MRRDISAFWLFSLKKKKGKKNKTRQHCKQKDSLITFFPINFTTRALEEKNKIAAIVTAMNDDDIFNTLPLPPFFLFWSKKKFHIFYDDNLWQAKTQYELISISIYVNVYIIVLFCVWNFRS